MILGKISTADEMCDLMCDGDDLISRNDAIEAIRKWRKRDDCNMYDKTVNVGIDIALSEIEKLPSAAETVLRSGYER